ncbi:MAG: hypothetical protein EOO09_12940 [Chitinophagaceae bacterium]|nr:MAG: hypothetical protein EOO09_12940 [Chitinophagaceae bacterium]
MNICLTSGMHSSPGTSPASPIFAAQNTIVEKLLFLFFTGLFFTSQALTAQSIITSNVNAELYTGTAAGQPLLVGLGGSEGGNAWSSDYWKPTRDSFLADGYAFLALGYFGSKGTPAILDRIAIDQVHAAILEAAKNPLVDGSRIAIIGGSRGGDLALLLGSYYTDITCVVAIVPSHVTFPGHTSHFTSPAWTFGGKDLPFVPVNEAAVPFLKKQDLRGAFSAMLLDSVAEKSAMIPVEKINGPVLLLSATEDRICPSTPMCEKMSTRLTQYKFPFHTEHHAIKGGHGEPLKHFPLVRQFLRDYFRKSAS